MRIRQHPTYRHRQLCTIVAIIRNLSKFETIFYRLPWQIAIARARRSRDAPRRVLFFCGTGYRQSRYASGSGYLALAAQGGKSSIRLRGAAISPALREGSIRVAFGRPIRLRCAHFIASLPHRSRGPSASIRHCLDTEKISTKYLLRLFRFKRLAANNRNEICSNQRDCNDEDDDRRECVNRWINALRHRIDEDRNILYAITRHEI